MIVDVLMPSLFPGLAAQAIKSLQQHGAGESVSLNVIVVGPEKPPADCTFVQETEPQGVNAAMRRGLAECRGDLILAACDDAIFTPGWLAAALDQFNRAAPLMGQRPYVIGLRYGPVQQVSTIYGRLFANLPLFRRTLLDDAFLHRHFMPDYLVGQWGDGAFGLAIWQAGGMVFDSHSQPLATWAGDRLGYPHARPNREYFDEDTTAFQRQWRPIFGQGWADGFRDFNVNCPVSLLRCDTVCIPHPAAFRRALDAHLE